MKKIPSAGLSMETDPYKDQHAVPDEPFGIPVAYWKAGLVLFSFVLMAATVIQSISGETLHVISALFAVPAILFAYFYRRRGVLIVYLLSMFLFGVIVLFRYPNTKDIFQAALWSILLIAIALTVSYLTHYLLLEKRKYHAIFDNTENGVVIVNLRDRSISEMNQRFQHSICLPQNGKTPANLNAFIEESTQVSGIFSQLESQCSSPTIEITLRRCDGTAWASMIVGRKISSDHAVLTFVDITDKKKMDAELHRLHEDANLYLDILTHDINNMNTASLNYGRLLEARPVEAGAVLAKKIVRTLEKSDEIIRNISALRKIRDGPVKRIPLSLSSVITGAIGQYPDAKIEYDGSNTMVLADDLLVLVFDNIIGNALKYGGKDCHIAIDVHESKTGISVSIADDGSGISDDIKPLIFERFQRGDTTVSGKGLGLHICKTLIDRYGGTILVEDRIHGDISKGTVFRITLQKA